MSQKTPIALTVNGALAEGFVEPRLSLADFLRHDLGLTGVHVGCEMGGCGACLVLQDGYAVHACLTLAVQAVGSEIVTLEGLSDSGAIADLQAAFYERNALQCGFCTPGVLATAHELLQRKDLLQSEDLLQNSDVAKDPSTPSRERIRDALSGNYCRCTGYEAIVDAIEATARRRRGQA